MKQSFYGGVHPNDRKELARHKEVAPLSAAPKQVVIAMAMHVGAPCKPIVAVGDQVKVGQKIGEIAGLGAPIHASVSGVVKAVEPRPYVGGGKVMSVVIENDFQDTWGSVLTPHPDYSKLSCPIRIIPACPQRRSWRLSRRRASPEWAAPASPPT